MPNKKNKNKSINNRYDVIGCCMSRHEDGECHLFKVLFERSPDAIFLETLTGKIIDCNQAAIKMFQYSKSELLKKSVTDLLSKKDGISVPKMVRNLINHGSLLVESYDVKRGGQIFPVEAHLKLVHQEGRPLIFVILRDITHHKEVEEKLKADQEQMKEIVSTTKYLLDSVPEGLFLVDIATKKVIRVNQTASKMMGYTEKELLGMKVEDLHPKKVLSFVLKQFGRLVDGRTKIARDVPVLRKDGGVFYVDVSANAIDYLGKKCSLGVFRDATDRRKTSQVLSDSKKRYDFVIKNTGRLIYDWDVKTGDIFWSGAIKEITGFSEREYQKVDIKRWEKLIHPEDRAEATRELAKAEKRHQRYMVEYRLEKKDGSFIFIEDSGAFNYDERGKATRMIGVMKNINERKKLELSLKTNEEFIRSVANGLRSTMIYQVLRLKDGTRKFTYLSGSVRELYGVTPEEGKANANYIYSKIYKDDQKRLHKMEESAVRRMAPLKIEVRMVNPSGTIRWSRFQSFPAKLPDGSICWNGVEVDLSEIKKQEESLLESEKKFRELFNNMEEGVAIFEIKNEHEVIIKDLNKAAEKLEKIRKKNIIGKKVDDIFLGIKQMGLYDVFIKVWKTGKPQHHPVSFYKDEYHAGWRDNYVYKINSGEVVAVYSDVTERKVALDALKENESKLSSVMDGSTMSQFVLDRNHKVLYWNKALEKLTGIKSKEIVGTSKQWMAFYNKEQPCLVDLLLDGKESLLTQYYDGNFKKSLLIRGGYEATDYFPDVGQKGRWLSFTGVLIKDSEGKVIGAVETMEDVTEVKKNLEDLKKAENKYASLIENSNDGIVIIQDGVVKFFNSKMGEMMGYGKKEIIDRPFLDFVTEKYRKMVAKKYTDRISGGHPENRYEFEILTKHNKNIPVEINSSSIDYEGRLAIMAIIRDVSKAKEIEKMKSDFVSVASHQLRTPLTGIKWFTELLLKGHTGELTEKQRDFIRQIEISNSRMLSLVDDLLDVSHIESGEKFRLVFKNENLSEIFRDLCSEMTNLAKNKNITLDHANVCDLKVVAKVDRTKIIQVFQNILDNAIKYSEAGSTIKVRCNIKGKEVIYSFQDQGKGIPKEQQSKIFERFFRADNVMTTESGTGLGLYIAKYILDMHDGKIWFDSEENKGSTFYISLPIIK